jgi:hypothetical protein
MDDALEDTPLYRAILELAGATAPDLMGTLVYEDANLGRVFPVLMNFSAEVVERELASGRLVAAKNSRGFEGGDHDMRRLSGMAVVYFLGGYARQFRDSVLLESLKRYTKTVAARLIDAARQPNAWGDLNERERALLEPVSAALLRNGICRGVADSRLALSGNALEPTLNFVVWWGRQKGRMPIWYRE